MAFRNREKVHCSVIWYGWARAPMWVEKILQARKCRFAFRFWRFFLYQGLVKMGWFIRSIPSKSIEVSIFRTPESCVLVCFLRNRCCNLSGNFTEFFMQKLWRSTNICALWPLSFHEINGNHFKLQRHEVKIYELRIMFTIGKQTANCINPSYTAGWPFLKWP